MSQNGANPLMVRSSICPSHHNKENLMLKILVEPLSGRMRRTAAGLLVAAGSLLGLGCGGGGSNLGTNINTKTEITGQNPNPSTVGAPVNITFAVSQVGGANPNAPVTEGDVKVTAAGASGSCDESLDNSGEGSCTLAFLTAGVGQSIKVKYQGSGQFLASDAEAFHTVSDTGGGGGGGETRLRIQNSSPTTIAIIRYTRCASAAFGGDRLGTSTIAPGTSFTFIIDLNEFPADADGFICLDIEFTDFLGLTQDTFNARFRPGQRLTATITTGGWSPTYQID
jgi:Big-like domain-containing protein